MVSKTIKCSQALLLLFFTEALIPQFPRARGPLKTSIRTLSTLLASSLDMPPLVIETPANDFTTEYYQFILPNGIPTTIVRVNAAEKSSCSLAVKAGAQDDPTDRQGLAHFTEHAVFLGSVKFPEERAYKEFLSKNGGSSNAGTGMESTVYKFEVNSKSFPHSLDLFSQFFKQPLFTEDAIAREVMAVDAEDSKNRIIDGRRILQVVKDLMLPDHPYAKFSTGNVKTLASGDAEKNKYEVTKAMRAFHVKHYKPENMALSLVGPQTIEEMKTLAVEMFSDIQYNGEVLDSASTMNDDSRASLQDTKQSSDFPFVKNNLILRVRPIKDVRDLSIVWSLDSTRLLYRNNPCRLIGFLLGHKGPGSVFATLQDKGWAMSNSAGTGTTYPDFSLFEASVALTEEGLENWEKVVEIIYSQIKNIADLDDAEIKRVWSEIKTTGSLNFKYREQATPYELAPFIAGNMLNYPSHHIISAGYLLDDVDISQFREFVAKLLPERAITTLRSRTFDWLPDDTPNDATAPDVHTPQGVGANRKEPWYGVSYHTEAPSNTLLNTWKSHRDGSVTASDTFKQSPSFSLSLPSANPFICYELADAPLLKPTYISTRIPTTTTAAASETALESGPEGLTGMQRVLRSKQPVAIRKLIDGENAAKLTAPGDVVWYSKDEVFSQPRSVFQCLLHTTNCADGHPENSLLSSVYSQIATRNLYNAGIAGLGYDVTVGARGISLTIQGYSPKLSELACKIFKDFGDSSFWGTVDPALVELCKERAVRSLKSWSKERPDTQCDSLLSYFMQENVWLPQDRLKAAEEITSETFIKRAQSALIRRRVTSHIHGDMSQEAALALYDQSMAILGSNTESGPVKSPEEGGLLVNEDGDIPARARLLKGHTVVALADPNPEDPNSALLTHIQMGNTTPRNAAIMMILRSLMGEPLFAELRTKKQLGYIVSLSSSGYGRAPGTVRGLTVRLLSNRFSPVAMQDELGIFFESQKDVFASLSQADLSNRAAALTLSLIDPPTSYAEEASEFWGAIVSGMPFDWTEQVVKELKELKVDAIQHAADEWLFNDEKRSSVSVMLFGNTHLEELKNLKSIKLATGKGFFPTLEESKICSTLEELTAQRNSLELFQDPSTSTI